jgi:hypothetical protein
LLSQSLKTEAHFTPQVIPVTDEQTPEEFGYVTFGFEVVTPSGGGVQKLLKKIVKYSFNDSYQTFIAVSEVQLIYKENKLAFTQTYAVFAGQQPELRYTNELFYDENKNVTTDSVKSMPNFIPMSISKFYYGNESLNKTEYYSSQNPNTVLWNCVYSYAVANHISIVEHIYGNQNGSIKSECVLDQNQNIINRKMYGMTNVLMSDLNYTYSTARNPLYHLFPQNADGPEYFSKYNIAKVTGLDFEIPFTDEYNWTYDKDGNATQLIKTSINSSNDVFNKEMTRFYY